VPPNATPPIEFKPGPGRPGKPQIARTPVEILAAVQKHFGIRRKDLIGQCRARMYSYPRALAMFLMRRFTVLSYPEIGAEMGGRDHSTVMHAVRKIEEVPDAKVVQDVRKLLALLSFTLEAVQVVTPPRASVPYYRGCPSA